VSQGYLPPGMEPDEPAIVTPAEDKVDKLARLLHLEWCDSCGDWRDLGHVDDTTSGKAGVRQAILEAQDFSG